MFLSPAGDTIFYRRRADGLDCLYAFRPDAGGHEHHTALASSRSQLRAWPTRAGHLIVCDGWPASPGGLSLKFYDMSWIARALARPGRDLNENLTDVPVISGFQRDRAGLPAEVFKRIRDERVVIPGLTPDEHAGRQVPALYELDGIACCYRVVPLPFIEPTALPGGLHLEPGSLRRWLTISDSSHLFVLHADTLELECDVIWPADQKALARVAFHPTRREAWVSAHASVFIYDLDSLELVGEVTIEEEERWHRGERVIGFIGGIAFSRNGYKALVARPLSGDIAEVDVIRRVIVGRIPVAIDPLELLSAPAESRIYMQSLRNGNVSWFPYR